jgi:hypothetical protein
MKKLQGIIFRAFFFAITAVAVYVNIHFIKTMLVHFLQAARSSQSLMMLILGAGLIALTCAGFALGRSAKIAPADVSGQMDVLTEQNFDSLLALESRRAGRPQPVAFAGRGSDLQQAHKSDPSGMSEPVLPAVVSATRTVVSAGWYGSRSSGEVFSSGAGVSANQADAAASRFAPTGGLPSKVVISISEGAHSLAAQNQALEERRAEEFAAAGGERGSKPPVAKTAKAFACSSEALG